jgi:ABC-2 type transport system ATP-binding protein
MTHEPSDRPADAQSAPDPAVVTRTELPPQPDPADELAEAGTTEGDSAADASAPIHGAESAADASERRPGASTDGSAAVVSVVGVSRKFGDRVVVRDMDLDVAAGTILGIVGPSGSGKTTTIRMVTGALAPTTGNIRVLGQRPTRFTRSMRERIGYMPQLFTLYPDLTARENVDFVASLLGLLWPRRRRRTKEVLTLLQLWDARNRRASNMSGGMQRRLELACALVHQPDLLILDEPTAGIDPLLRVTIWEELHRLRDAGRTLMVTTQYVSEAEECDQVALIAGGRLIAYAPPEELRRQATGGDIIEIETAKVVDASSFESLPGVLRVRQLEPRRIRVTVEDAATGLPGVVEAVGATGAEVASAQEQRISFDEVFAELVARHRAENGHETDGEEAAA